MILKRRVPRLDLRRRLLLFFVLILLPLIVLAYGLIRDSVDHTRDQLLNSTAAAAELTASNVDEFLTGTESLLQAIAEMPQLKNSEPDSPIPIYDNLYLENRNFANIFATDRQGNNVSALFMEAPGGFSVADSDFFRVVIESGKPAFSGRTLSAATGSPVIAAAVPVRSWSSEQSGILVGYLSLAKLRQDAVNLAIRKHLSMIVVDSRGVVLVHPEWQKVTNSTDLSGEAPVRAALSGQLGSTEYTDPRGQRWLAGYAPVPHAGWGIVVLYPASEAYEYLQYVLLTRLGMLSLAVVVALALAFLLSERIVAPLRRLAQFAETTLAGLVGGQVQRGSDELDQMEMVVSSLCSQLSTNLSELNALKAELRTDTESPCHQARRNANVREMERRRIAGEIHDGITQLVSAALQETRAMKYVVRNDPQNTVERMEIVQNLLVQAIAEMRRIIGALRPLQLEQMGLVPAVEALVRQYRLDAQVTCDFEAIGKPFTLGRRREVAVFRVVQEALANVARHAEAEHVLVELRFSRLAFVATIKDDGRGFDLASKSKSHDGALGLIAMRERAQSIGGELSIHSSIGRGTTVYLEVPLSIRSKDQSVLFLHGDPAEEQKDTVGSARAMTTRPPETRS